ncbi:CoA transferase [Saccharopolyspora erythraea]|uniref:CoA transferase n=1 Tax=Saccharopolyspora erythraea TaxID=1836 RepID=UPI001BA74696|nr:CoA transferase [Saccharopolyspora erythraea]QUH03294.1 CoA transferase [Saccharopolyspora erythraea]
MTLSPTSSGSRCAVASEVAARNLALLPDLPPDEPECEIDWAGPVDLPLGGETAVQAACGIMHVHGRAFGRPTPLAVDYASATAGVLAAQGVLAVRIARARGLELRGVRTSVSQAALIAVSQYLAAATADDPEEPRPAGAPDLRSSDGVWFEIETLDALDWLRFWSVLEADPGAVRRGWRPFQQRFATATCALPAPLRETAASRTFAAITEAATATGISVLPVRDRPGHPADVPAWRITPMPEGEVRPSGRPGALPLEGLVVVESTRRVQGPVAGHLLRLLGAEVVRIEPPGGDPMRGIPPMAGDCSARFSALNAGKRVVELDLKSAAGRRGVHELVADADVFLHNWAPGKAEQLGLDACDLARSRPGLIHAWASGWGPEFGEDPPLGTDFLVQAHSGLAAAVGPDGAAPRPSLMTLTDVMGGLVCAQGVLAALLNRLLTRRGARVDSSLFSAAGVIPRARTTSRGPLRTADGFLVLEPESWGQVAAALAPGAGPEDVETRCAAAPTVALQDVLRAAGVNATAVCTDLRALAADPRFGRALGSAEHAFPLAPWEFS